MGHRSLFDTLRGAYTPYGAMDEVVALDAVFPTVQAKVLIGPARR